MQNERETRDNDFIIKGYLLEKYTGNAEHVILPDGIMYIDSKAFVGCDRIKAISLPDSMDVINCYQFKEMTSLETIVIKSVADIEFSSIHLINNIEIKNTPMHLIAVKVCCGLSVPRMRQML